MAAFASQVVLDSSEVDAALRTLQTLSKPNCVLKGTLDTSLLQELLSQMPKSSPNQLSASIEPLFSVIVLAYLRSFKDGHSVPAFVLGKTLGLASSDQSLEISKKRLYHMLSSQSP